MKNLILTILITLHISLFTFHVFSQPCLPEGITFTTQEQIDNFQINYPNCTEIEGDVIIVGDNITNLGGLSMLTSIEGNWRIGICEFMTTFGTSIVNFEGLNNLAYIGGDFTCVNNDLLADLSGLESLLSIDGDLKIGGSTPAGFSCGNLSLINLSGLDNLITIGGSLETERNDSLKSFAGLENIDSIQGIITTDPITSLVELNNLLYIGDDGIRLIHTELNSLSGLENVSLIDGDLVLNLNDSLTSLSGLENLVSINGSLIIGGFHPMSYGNPSLPSLTGLNNLTSIDGWIYIKSNEGLTNIAGLENIDAGSIDSIYIANNISLAECDVMSICDYFDLPNGIVEIHDNAPGCNSPQEVEEACDTLSVHEIKYDNTLLILPNPVGSFAIIEYILQQKSPVILQIFDLTSQEIVTLVDEVQQKGENKIVFNTAGLPSGIYFCVLKTNPPCTGQTIKLIKL